MAHNVNPEEVAFTEVATNAIWRETIRREQASAKLRTNFSVPDSSKIPLLPEKPNKITPQSFDDPEEIAAAPVRLAALTTLKDQHLTPAQRYEQPLTASQVIGWHARPLQGSQVSKELFNKPRGTCDVTQYAAAYYAMTGTTPFSRPLGGPPS